MKRLSDWRGRLVAAIDAWALRPADAPDTNCGFFAADCVMAMTGFDPAAGLRGRGLDIAGGLVALRAAGYRDAIAFAAASFEEAPPSHAQTGDLAVVITEVGELALGVFNGATIAVVHPGGGVGFLPFDQALRAFRI